ncbi:MAG: putative sulfate exporter family transporter [Burkholderiales bacterium]|nr:putative sulfate exporter family transporter [Burkholderiales bacterium]
MHNWQIWCKAVWRGTLMAIIIGAASMFISEKYGGPAVLFALLFGMAFHFLSEDKRTLGGIQFCSTTVLRIGVALLGARITADQLSLLSPGVLLIIVGGVFATVLFGFLINKYFKSPVAEATLAAASTAICGASAAIALAATMNRKQLREQALLAIVVTVTALSTVAMIIYPSLCGIFGFDQNSSGLFLGGTIHDVAQVVGAGAMIGPDALQIASMTKMLRVAMLIPMLILFMFTFASKKHREEEEKAKPWYKNIPTFLVAFIILAALNATGLIPSSISEILGEISRLFILISIAALGLKTSLGKLKEVGWTLIILMTLDTLFLLFWVVGGILLIQ